MQRFDVVLVADGGRAKAKVPYARLCEVSAAFRALDDLFDDCNAAESPEFSIDVPGVTQSLMHVVAAIVILKKSNDAASLDEASRHTIFAALEFLQVPAEVMAPLIDVMRPKSIMRVCFDGVMEVEFDVKTDTTVNFELEKTSAVILLSDSSKKTAFAAIVTCATSQAAVDATDTMRAALFDGFMAALNKVASLGSPYESVHKDLASFVDLNSRFLFVGSENAKAFSERLLAPDVSSVCREALLPAAVRRDKFLRQLKRPRSGSSVPILNATVVKRSDDDAIPSIMLSDILLPALSPVSPAYPVSDDE
jgi:hypothetical protein